MFRKFVGVLAVTRADEGVTSVEYALLAMLIAMVSTALVTSLRARLRRPSERAL